MLAAQQLHAQLIWNMGTSAANASPSSGTPITNLSVSTLTTGNNSVATVFQTVSVSSGYTGASGSYNAAAIARTGTYSSATSAYFEFTLTPAAGYQVVVNTIAFGSRSTKTGPARFAIRVNKDAYASSIAGGLLTANSVWMRKSLSNLSLASDAGTALTIRIYGYEGIGSNPSNANWRIDDLNVDVTVVTAAGVCSGVPASSSVLSSEGSVLCSDDATSTLSLSTNYTGSSNIIYQWQQATGTDPYQNISGAVNATYTIPGTLSQTTSYRALITCATTSDVTTATPLTITVNASPAITSSPTAQSGCIGGTASFSVAATGTGLSYAWYRLSSGTATQLTNGANVSGAATATVTLSNLSSSANSGSYYAVVQNSNGCQKTTVDVALTLNTPVSITNQPQPVTTSTGSSATFSVTATGDISGYQWRKDGMAIPGATASSYTISSASSADAGNYSVIVTGTGACASVTSADATLTVSGGLPVTLLRFSGSIAGNDVLLQWQVADEQHIAGYVIERSTDGLQFEQVGFVDATPEQASVKTYRWRDENAPRNGIYYRLKTREQTGQGVYSSIIRIQAFDTPQPVALYPNPVETSLEVRGVNGVRQVTIFNAYGQAVWRGQQTFSSTQALDMSMLRPGVYVLEICGSADRSSCQHLRFVKR